MEQTPETTSLDNKAETPTYTKDFTEEIQHRIVAMMIYDQEAFLKVKDIIRPEYFENPVLTDLVRIILAYHKEYSQRIDIEELTQELDSFLDNSKRPLPREVYTEQFIKILSDGAEQYGGKGFKYILDQVVAWTQYQLVKIAILKSINLLQKKKDYTAILEEIRSAVAVGDLGNSGLTIPSDLGYEEKPIHWLWPKVVPFSMVTIISGDSSVGKTFVGIEMAARLSNGRPFPGCSEESAVTGKTLYMINELPIEEVFLPRLIASGVKRGMVYPFTGAMTVKGQLSIFDITKNMPMIEAFVAKHPGIRLLVVDPAVSFVSENAKLNEAVAARHIMDHLVRFAAKTGLAVVVILHLNKDMTQKLINRIAGSHQILAAVPMGWVVGFDTKDPRRLSEKRRLMMPSKSNLGRVEDSYAYRVVDAPHLSEKGETIETGRGEWEEEPIYVENPEGEISPGIGLGRKRTKVEEAKEWILERLHNCDRIMSTELKTLACQGEGFSETTYDRAFAELRKPGIIDSRPDVTAGGGGDWWVSLRKG